MAYRIDTGEPLGIALQRIATEQLDSAVAALEPGPDGVTPSGVHAARKSLKKTRSLVRVARPALGRKAYAQANAALRDAGHLLSGARDADVMIATSDEIAARYVGQVAEETFAAMRGALVARAAEVRHGEDDRGPADEASTAIAEIRSLVASWGLEKVRRKTVVAALRTTYARGAGQFAVLRQDQANSEASHDWRKRVKDLWYQQRLIAPAWPAMLEVQAEEAHVLSEHLGDDHDLAVLRDHLMADGLGLAVDLAPVIELVDRRRGELSRLAHGLGARIYAERPGAFARRIDGYVRIWRSEENARTTVS